MAKLDNASREFEPVSVAVMTVSDTRTEETDTSGKTLVDRIVTAGHRVAEKVIVTDNKYLIRAHLCRWIADENVNAVIVTGGTGLTGRDVTPEAATPLFDKTIDGFGELFRYISYDEIKTSTMQSRAIAGIANGTFIFCLPGSSGACRTAWDHILQYQLDIRHGPCNLVEIMPRARER
jgi:molybdenum cofactor biosynthesis protein B